MSFVIPQIARQIGLPSGGMLHIFSSHSWAYSERRREFHGMLEPWQRGVDFQDHSISRAHPLDTETDISLARELSDIISQMDALVLMAGMYANHSVWMNFEIHAAFNFKVPIIPIADHGQQRMPREALRFASCEPVRWRRESIREAMLAYIKPERRRAFEAALQHRANLAKIERQRRVLATTRQQPSSPPPTLIGGRSNFALPPDMWTVPGRPVVTPKPRTSLLAQVLAESAWPRIVPGGPPDPFDPE